LLNLISISESEGNMVIKKDSALEKHGRVRPWSFFMLLNVF